MENLCKGQPIEFSMYLNYCKGLRFDEEPNYCYLKRIFLQLFEREGFKMDYHFGWTQQNYNYKHYDNGKRQMLPKKDKSILCPPKKPAPRAPPKASPQLTPRPDLRPDLRLDLRPTFAFRVSHPRPPWTYKKHLGTS